MDRETDGVQSLEWMRTYDLIKNMNGMVKSEKVDLRQKRENLFFDNYTMKNA